MKKEEKKRVAKGKDTSTFGMKKSDIEVPFGNNISYAQGKELPKPARGKLRG